MFFKKKKGKHKKNKGGKFTINTYKSSGISKLQMMEIVNTVISKKRLFVFAESM
jgi:hypothetical protein